MSRDHRLPEFSPYVHMHELQPPPQPHHYLYPPHQHPPALSSPSAAPTYEMTAASAGNACADSALPPAQSLHPLDHRKRRNSPFGGASDYEMSDAQCSGSDRSGSTSRKRKSSSYGSASAYDDDCCDDSLSSRSTLPDKKQNHSEIEKRRRDKMNTYISELSAMIPMCGAMARKLDKLTVLRMAVQHLRGVRGALAACPLSTRPRPACLPERDLNQLLLHAAAHSDAFLLVVGCDRGRLLYVSHSVTALLRYDRADLLGQSMFDILHPKDVAKVKEQLSSSDLSPRERLIDAKTMLPVKSDVLAGAQRLCPGARRSFFCRIKCKQATEPAAPDDPPAPAAPAVPVKEEADVATKHTKKNEKKYCVVQCTGYLKSWMPADVESGGGGGGGGEGDEEASAMSCLVAVGRALPHPAPRARLPSAAAAVPGPPLEPSAPAARPLQYVSRHAIDGKFLFVDQRVTLALGFLPQELLGTSLYEYVVGPELGGVARAHKHALLRTQHQHTPPYAFRRKDGSTATIQTHFKPFRNPWTKDVECLVANNSIVADAHGADDAQLSYEAFKQTDEEWRKYLTGASQERAAPPRRRRASPDRPRSSAGAGDVEVQRLIDSQVESHKIGSAIAEEALHRPPSAVFSSPHHLLQDPVFNTSSLVDNILGVDLSAFTVRNNGPLSGGEGGGAGGAGGASPPLALDGNGEAAMAVIMSLLEADAGLGGPVNFSGLPWPLP